MPKPDVDWRHYRGVIGQTALRKGPDAPELPQLRRLLDAARATARIDAILSETPPLSADQADYLTGMLRGLVVR